MLNSTIIIVVILTGSVAIAVIWYINRLYRSLYAEKLQANALFHHATQGIIVTNKKGEILTVNPEAEKLFGYEPGELLNRSIELLIPDRIRRKHEEYRKDFYHHPSSRRMGHGRDLLATKKDGQEFPVEVSLSYYEQKNSLYVVAFIVDITQRKLSEKKMLEQHLALAREKELNEIKSKFVSMASHEFRTPLSTVLSSASLIQNYVKEEDQEKRQKHVKRIKDSVKHLNELLEDFLSLGKLEEGKIRIEISQFDVQPFLNEVAEELNPALKPGQRINYHHKGALHFVTDKRLLRNILLNLLGNAIKFSPENSSIECTAAIPLGMGEAERNLRITVTDRGIGIPEEDQPYLFSSFFRGSNAVNIQGTGLGLHIVQRYLQLIGGSIQLESKPGEGTSVTIDLPNLSKSAHATHTDH